MKRPPTAAVRARSAVDSGPRSAGTSWCARGAIRIEVGQPDAIGGQAINVWCLDVGCAVAAKVAIAGVISHDQDDVGPLGLCLRSRSNPARPQQIPTSAIAKVMRVIGEGV